MCLRREAYIETKVLNRLEKEKTVTYYKLVVKYTDACNNKLDFQAITQRYTYYAGRNDSRRLSNKLNEDEEDEVHIGIHVCLSLADARRLKKEEAKNIYAKNLVIIPVKCKLKHFVAAGVWSIDGLTENAVFTEISIDKETAKKYGIRRRPRTSR